MNTNSANDLRRIYKTTVIIGLAMMASLLIYTVIVELMNRQYEPMRELAGMAQVLALLRYVFLGIAVVEFFAIQFLKKRMLSLESPVIAPEPQRLLVASIVAFALSDSVATLGFVLFLVGRNTSDFYLFLVISLFFFAVFFPRYDAWEEWMQEAMRTRRGGDLSATGRREAT